MARTKIINASKTAGMNIRYSVVAVIALLLCPFYNILHAQESSLLDDIKDTTATTEYVSAAFKSTRVVDGQSIEMLGKGSLDFRILHRFGPISGGTGTLFGLDQSYVRFGFDWAPINDLLIGIGRSSTKKEIDGFVKYRLLQQSRGARELPFSVVLVGGAVLNTLPFNDPAIPNYFSSRLNYFFQTLVGSKLTESISLQLSPTVLHRNLVNLQTDPNDIFALGFGGRIKLTNRVAFMVEYFHSFNGMVKGVNQDPLSIGFDIETGGHVFQLHLTNSSGLNERAFLTDTFNKWARGEIQFGFNISRVFQL